MGDNAESLQNADRELECDDTEQRSNERLGKLLANPQADHIDAAFKASSDSMRAIREAPTVGPPVRLKPRKR